jgi:hypothetical protein
MGPGRWVGLAHRSQIRCKLPIGADGCVHRRIVCILHHLRWVRCEVLRELLRTRYGLRDSHRDACLSFRVRCDVYWLTSLSSEPEEGCFGREMVLSSHIIGEQDTRIGPFLLSCFLVTPAPGSLLLQGYRQKEDWRNQGHEWWRPTAKVVPAVVPSARTRAWFHPKEVRASLYLSTCRFRSAPPFQLFTGLYSTCTAQTSHENCIPFFSTCHFPNSNSFPQSPAPQILHGSTIPVI